MRCSCPVPLAEKHPQSIMFPPPCLTVGVVFLGSWAAFLLLQTRRVKLMSILDLISSDHNTFTQFSSESLPNFRRTCAFLSRGTLWALQDFIPLRHRVLPIVFLVTMVPAALKSSIRSSRVVSAWSHVYTCQYVTFTSTKFTFLYVYIDAKINHLDVF